MKAYQLIFPDSDEPCMTLSLRHKVGRVPKGSYRFVEGYCCEPHCDCRRAALFVINEKGKEKALISFGFDPDEPMAGPFLDSAHRPAPYAQELVDYFVEMINSDAEWLEGMYQRYQAVREKCDGMPYRGKPFPLPGLVLRRVVPPPSDFEPALEEMLGQLSSREPVSGSQKLRRFVLQQKAGVPAGPDAPVQEEGVEAFVAESEQSGTGWSSYSEHSSLLERLRQHLLSDPRAGEQLVQLLVDLCRQTPETDARRIDAALRVLSDVMQLLKLDLELGRSGGQERMEALQMALAQRIFTEGENIELCAAVSQLLLQNRVEILPELLQAKNQRVLGEVAELDGLPEGDIMEELCHSLEQMGLSSPFEGVETLLRIFALGNAEMQIELTSKLLVARNPFIRDMAALMLFHPDSTVRLGVARLLASSDGHTATAETLRRMIVSRNWFSPPIKKELDQAIIHARKAHVECAPLATHPSMTVYASTIDGAGA